MGKVGRPRKFKKDIMGQLRLIAQTDNDRTAQNFHYMAEAVKVLILDEPEIPYIEILFDSKTQKYKSQSSLVELGRLYDLIESEEGQKVATNFLIEYTRNLLVYANDNNLKSKEIEQLVRYKKLEIKEVYKDI